MSKARDLADFQGSASALTTGTLPVDRVPYVGRRNLIINGGFDVWQRGTSFSGLTNGTYSVDRWVMFGTVGDENYNVSQDLSMQTSLGIGANFTRNSGSGETGLCQFIEDFRSMPVGTPVTLSFYAQSSADTTMTVRRGARRGVWAQAVSIENSNIDIGTDVKRYTVTFNVPDWTLLSTLDGAHIYVQLAFPANVDFTLWQVQLELGSVATPFEHRSYGEELALCQRYYEVGTVAWEGYAYNTSNYVGHRHSWTVTKRSTPSVSVSAVNNYGYANGGRVIGIDYTNAMFNALPTATGGGRYLTLSYTADAEL